MTKVSLQKNGITLSRKNEENADDCKQDTTTKNKEVEEKLENEELLLKTTGNQKRINFR